MSFINKIITKSHQFIKNNTFILNSIKKILKLCPFLEEKICNVIEKENKDILLSKTGEKIFNIISSPNFEKKAKKKQKIDKILNLIDESKITDEKSAYKENKHPKSDDIKYLTWKESVQMLNEKLELITK